MSTRLTATRAVAATVALLGLGVLGHRAASAKKSEAGYFLSSTPDHIYRGFFPRDAEPALTVPSGAIVRIDTVSHQGLNNLGSGPDPVAFGAQFGVSADLILQDATDIHYNLDYANRTKPGGGTHVLTGPIYVEGAEPGDTLEVRVLKVEARVPWGYNTQGTGGALPGYLSASSRKTIFIKGDVALFKEGVDIPLKPFQGIMGVAAADDFVSPNANGAAGGFVHTGPPGPFGGNMDLNDLGEGTSLYLPVFRTGGQFFTGDPHQVQGNGEVSGNALEQSNTITVQLVLHKGGGLTGPRAETPTHLILMGIALDHDDAFDLAFEEVLDLLQAEKGLSLADARSFSSLAVDFNIAESVDQMNLVMGRIPKRFFVDEFKIKDFWHKPLRALSEGQRQGLDGTK